ncbi:gliding motility-associated C-terminal domain-containing protein [Spirosoma sp. KCTC 42546]|uniref:T9SS type B sorting domain-containing protein n=1 Tax=Spirosoma sp. KCTC 42546 TaxID=2520506 RepID=UPI001158B35E|nr:gliding motility-associated C-terminal domain-containing protein [Spirosoma sp. KCTC 42546]QDK82337.1 gliding motility-associated C-terminal domain-containing protein [Spirosoma sp. KCTC 42546]
MRFVYTIGLWGLFLGIVLFPSITQATHVRAGEITTKRISQTSLTYLVTFTAYYDEVKGRQAADQAEPYTFCFGDGSTLEVKRSRRQYINGRTSSVNSYTAIHTYPGPGVYTIGITVPNRNADTKNLPPPATSDQIRFFVSTTILINAALLTNSTPVMLNPPLDSGRVGQKFCHNPAAFDADGDSLAYRLSVPKTSLTDNGCIGRDIPVYQDPTRFSTSSEAGGTPTFTINPITGELCWDAPGEIGQFNFAFIIEEWRNGVLIGEITRDMQIIVTDSPNKRPLIAPIPDLCVEAGTLITQPVTATDPDGQRVIITGFGGVFNVGQDGLALAPGELIQPAYARLINGGIPQPQPATATFSWQTNCNQLRDAPYDVTFKVNDVPNKPTPSLVSFQTFRIQLVGPAIKNLTARPTVAANGRAVQLSWDAYTCGNTGTTITIYRKAGCQVDDLPPCVTGVPAGYTKIAEVASTATSYIDTTTLNRGGSYSYRVVAVYPDVNGGFNGGVSLSSNKACLELPLLSPVITQVTVDSTSANGQITVKWTRPLGLNPSDLSGPYQYRLQRATDLNGTNFVPIATINTTLLPTAPDTIYVDRGTPTSTLNTANSAYRYRLEFYYTNNGTLTRLDVTDAASSVRLAAAPANRQIVLSWQANTPWSNDNQTHDIYRSRSGPNGPFNKIREVRVSTPTYTFTDDGSDTFLADGNTSRVLSADSSYCYRVMTRGQYTDTQLSRLGILQNYSQILCAQPGDTTRPCPPNLSVDSLNCASLSTESLCDQTSFTNKLTWTPGSGPTCDPNIASYKIYYGRYRTDTLGVLSSVDAPTMKYDHSGLSTVAGCYYVTAVSKRGLESSPSNQVCVDACPSFVLPNVFTPNGDGKNDVFAPLHCPRFVSSVSFVVYNRWGAKLYETSGATLAWDGRSSDGVDLPTGLYYYQASVRFALLDKNAPPQIIKGWVQILREGVSAR